MNAVRTICEVIDYGGETGGSFIPAMSALARAVEQRGDRFVVISTDVPGASWHDEFVATGAELRLIRDAREVVSELKALRPDIVHSHFSKYDIPVLRASLRSKVVCHVHSARENFSRAHEIRARVKYMVISAGVRRWICVSSGIANEVLQRGAPRSRVRVIPNGVDTNRFRPPTPAERSASRAQFGLKDNDRALLFFDRTPVKGGSVVRTALDGKPGFRLLLNGGRDDQWRAFAQRNDVIFTPRFADPRPLYWAADALVLASFGEGFAFVLAEAAASGLPVAASDIPPARDMVGGYDGAFIFPVGDAPALADAVARALEHGPSVSLRERVVTAYSLERWTRDMLGMYDAI